jgi:hypothetical protein
LPVTLLSDCNIHRARIQIPTEQTQVNGISLDGVAVSVTLALGTALAEPPVTVTRVAATKRNM